MHFAYSDRCKDYLKRVSDFMDAHVYEGNEVYERQHTDFGPDARWKVPPVIEDLKSEAKAAGLWNMFHPDPDYGPGL
ncbi:MAG: acyl-CoA dehydrogenase, partial [Pseudomonadota bacterium]